MKKAYTCIMIGFLVFGVFLFMPTPSQGDSDLLYEDFSSGLPSGWTVMDGENDGYTWQTANPASYNVNSPFANPSMIVDSHNSSMNEELISPAFDASGCLESVTLTFANCFVHYAFGLQEIGDVDVSTDGGANWLNVFRMQGQNYGPGMTAPIDITSVAGYSDVRIRFHYYDASSDYWWILDNVHVVSSQNRPVADAGNDQSAYVGNQVTLDASASHDPDGEQITYSWGLVSAPAGSGAALDDPAAAQPVFTIDLPGDYIFSLVVTDAAGNDSTPDQVTVSTLNSPPVADAGNDQTVHAGDAVILCGTNSYDPDGDGFSYSWTIDAKPAGSTAALNDPSDPNPVFTADKIGEYRMSLVVTDIRGSSSDPDEVVVSTQNSAPLADAGEDQAASLWDTVTLDGSLSSDPDGDSITFSWALVSAPSGSSAALSDPGAAKPTFVADSLGDYVFRLTVTDSYNASSQPDQVVVSTVNSRPSADAGEDQTIHIGVPAELSGSGADPDGDPISYAWQFTAIPQGSQASLEDADTAAPSFTPDKPGNYTLALVVSDIWGAASDPDYVVVSTMNTKPVADAGPDIAATLIGEPVYLDGSSSSDPDGDPISYQWSLRSAPGGSQAALINADTPTPYFVPDVYGDFIFELIVSDLWSQSNPDTVLVSFENIRPVADAGEGQAVVAGDQVTLDGSGSSDANGDPVTYQWSLTTPPGSQAHLDHPSSVTPSFLSDEPGTYTATLIVNDGLESSDPSSVSIEVAQSGGDLNDLLQSAIQEIKGLDDACFRNRIWKRILILKINVTIRLIDRECYRCAYLKLQYDILRKMNGCGEFPDRRDWIRCCSGQQQVRPLILEALGILEGLI